MCTLHFSKGTVIAKLRCKNRTSTTSPYILLFSPGIRENHFDFTCQSICFLKKPETKKCECSLMWSASACSIHHSVQSSYPALFVRLVTSWPTFNFIARLLDVICHSLMSTRENAKRMPRWKLLILHFMLILHCSVIFSVQHCRWLQIAFYTILDKNISNWCEFLKSLEVQ